MMCEGCVGPRVPIKQIDALSPEERRTILELPIYDNSQLTGKEHVVIKGVEGVSCQDRREDPAVTETEAITAAKYWAKEQGAEGIKNLNCAPPRGKTIFHHCWESITCTGQAIKFAK
jgi:hypothetical protein